MTTEPTHNFWKKLNNWRHNSWANFFPKRLNSKTLPTINNTNFSHLKQRTTYPKIERHVNSMFTKQRPIWFCAEWARLCPQQKKREQKYFPSFILKFKILSLISTGSKHEQKYRRQSMLQELKYWLLGAKRTSHNPKWKHHGKRWVERIKRQMQAIRRWARAEAPLGATSGLNDKQKNFAT